MTLTDERMDDGGLIHDKHRLAELQALPLERKIGITQARIIEWYTHYNGQVAVSFSGGKDSTVLLHIARSLFPDIRAVYADTGLEFPELKSFVRSFPNVEIIRPQMTFPNVLSTYGYPLIGKEVAEAIHYARRHDGIEGGTSHVPQNHHGNARAESSNLPGCGVTPRKKRTELAGRYQWWGG